MKYKVCFSGFAYVEAENEENAQEIYEDGDIQYEETEVTEIFEVDEFRVNFN